MSNLDSPGYEIKRGGHGENVTLFEDLGKIKQQTNKQTSPYDC